jgi:DNA-binding CsgD family transcriptional regulator
MGTAAAFFSLLLGLFIQTVFYEVASTIPSVIRQDAHISLPLCRSFPDLYGCDAWVGKWTGLEIWEISHQVGIFSGLFLNLILVLMFSMQGIIRGRSKSSLPGLLTGIIDWGTTLILALIVGVPMTFSTLTGIFGIVLLWLVPFGGFVGGVLGRKQLTRLRSQKGVTFIPREGNEHFAELGEGLSRRELEVLALAASGSKNDEIAQVLYISKATVKTHLQHIYEKLGVTNRTAAVTKAMAQGWLLREDEISSD